MRFTPRDERFYDLLERQAECVVRGAKLLYDCLQNHTSLQEVALVSTAIHDVEHEGDHLVHQTMERLNKSFITPLDREDIFALITRLDDVLDYIDAVGKRLVTFKIARPTPHCIEFGRILVRSAEEVQIGVSLLQDLGDGKRLLQQCAKIDSLESEADQVMRGALGELFNGEMTDPIEVIKWKDLYEHLEIATDKCEDVANILEAVLVKYS